MASFIYFGIPIFLSTLFFIKLLLLFFTRFNTNMNLPPSPPSLPIIGHLHLFKKPLHRTLVNLSEAYGPVFLLRFGVRRVIIVSSHSLVQECFTKNDINFANRPQFSSGKHLSYNYTIIGVAPYGEHWRNLRRILTLELFSTTRLQSLTTVRASEVNALLRLLLHEYNSNEQGGFQKVELKPKFFELVFNVMLRTVAGKRCSNDKTNEINARSFLELVEETFAFSGVSNIGDFLPILRLFDFQGVKKKVMKLEKLWDDHLQLLINEHRNGCIMNGKEREKTMIDVLLSMQQADPDIYPDKTIKSLIMSPFSAGTDTSAATLEWAMALLLNNPEVLEKMKVELAIHIGDKRLIQEEDLSSLPYLNGVLYETLRLYPATPLLLPHESIEDCKLSGLDVPRKTILLANVYAIHRDPSIWHDPLKFKPERFLEGGEEKMLLPFGLGRRRCPGEGFALRLVPLALGAMIQCFEWKKGEEEVDMEERPGLTMPKAKPLKALYKPHMPMANVLQQV
ncbi:hypothetical protein J5N97_013862 [Dioscorea zingiberensis]|uniref:Cytochrome P450 n=1 Tax=Dioscorea zingiberensis TaxID=325984 RepID=A0A9D5CS14_9LILI|nr:hypothetical protein J5N97_013862 [Dioscorea zingiberensis]